MSQFYDPSAWHGALSTTLLPWQNCVVAHVTYGDERAWWHVHFRSLRFIAQTVVNEGEFTVGKLRPDTPPPVRRGGNSDKHVNLDQARHLAWRSRRRHQQPQSVEASTVVCPAYWADLASNNPFLDVGLPPAVAATVRSAATGDCRDGAPAVPPLQQDGFRGADTRCPWPDKG